MGLTKPTKCDCVAPDLNREDWPEASFTECRKCLAIEVKFNASPSGFVSVPRRAPPVDAREVGRMIGGVLYAAGAVALAVFAWGLP